MVIAKRPWGVTLLAILSIISVVSYAVLMVLAVAAPEGLRSLLGGLSPQGSGPAKCFSISGRSWGSISP